MLKAASAGNNATASPQRGSVAIRTILATFVPQFAFGLSFAWISLAPAVMRESHWSAFVIEAVYALTPLSSSLAFLFSGQLVARIAPRRLCWLGISSLIVGTGVAFVFPMPLTFIVFYAMLALGVGYGLMLAASLAAMASLFPRRIGTAGGALSAAYGLAAIVEVPVIARLTVSYAWLDALRLVGGVVITLAVVALLLMPAIPRSQEHVAGVVLPLHLLKNHRVATAALLEVVAVPLGSYALSQVGIYARDLGLAVAVGTTAVVIAAIANTCGRFLSGWLSDHVQINLVILLIVLVDALGGLALWRTSEAIVLLIAAGAVGFACGGLGGTVPRLTTDALPEAFSAISGLLFAAYALGGFIGPLLGSALGGGTLAWLVLSSISATSVLMTLWRILHASRDRRTGGKALPLLLPSHTTQEKREA